MSNYENFIDLLRSKEDKKPEDSFTFISPNLGPLNQALTDVGIESTMEAEGLSIDLSQQSFKIYKTPIDAVKYLNEGSFDQDIVVISPPGDGDLTSYLIYKSASQNPNSFFENIIQLHRLKKVLLLHDIASHDNVNALELIFLSSKHGKISANYKKSLQSNFHFEENNLKSLINNLTLRFERTPDYLDFFKERIIKILSKNQSSHRTLVKVAQSLDETQNAALRDYKLFKNNFSFEEFKSKFDEGKEKYLKEYQSNLSDLLSKISSMPVQFGLYIYLIVRFEKDTWPMIIVLGLIISWSCFKYSATTRILENINYLKCQFTTEFSLLIEKSGIEESNIANDKSLISSRFDKTISLISGYRTFIVLFSSFTALLCIFFLIKSCPAAVEYCTLIFENTTKYITGISEILNHELLLSLVLMILC